MTVTLHPGSAGGRSVWCRACRVLPDVFGRESQHWVGCRAETRRRRCRSVLAPMDAVSRMRRRFLGALGSLGVQLGCLRARESAALASLRPFCVDMETRTLRTFLYTPGSSLGALIAYSRAFISSSFSDLQDAVEECKVTLLPSGGIATSYVDRR
ncbi:unnamed protein product [Pleuronectes platessa]|uniref:Uncharacterized protein n=1 Tax=Pleuronectes platessa TaxID=8262 RepID=A0A9N7ZDZ6_PLEPL|nr:unnamed protein product [Pleuronectes platessa]